MKGKGYPKNRKYTDIKKIKNYDTASYYTPLFYTTGYSGKKRGRKTPAERQQKIEEERFRFAIKQPIITFD